MFAVVGPPLYGPKCRVEIPLNYIDKTNKKNTHKHMPFSVYNRYIQFPDFHRKLKSIGSYRLLKLIDCGSSVVVVVVCVAVNSFGGWCTNLWTNLQFYLQFANAINSRRW